MQIARSDFTTSVYPQFWCRPMVQTGGVLPVSSWRLDAFDHTTHTKTSRGVPAHTTRPVESTLALQWRSQVQDRQPPVTSLIMRPSSLGGGRILRRTLSVCLSVCLSVRPSVCPSVRPSRYRCHGWRIFGPASVTSRHLANYSDTQVLFGTRWGPHIVQPSRPHKFLLYRVDCVCLATSPELSRQKIIRAICVRPSIVSHRTGIAEQVNPDGRGCAPLNSTSNSNHITLASTRTAACAGPIKMASGDGYTLLRARNLIGLRPRIYITVKFKFNTHGHCCLGPGRCLVVS